jgi:futalosine hydrolase
MKLLIVTATEAEIKLFKDSCSDLQQKYTMSFLHTGVGMAVTAYALTKEITKHNYDLVINAGIAGSFFRGIKVGEVVMVQNELFAELGAEDDTAFIKFSEMNLPGPYAFKNAKVLSGAYYSSLKKVKAATVNKVNGNEENISAFIKLHATEIESMEGASVAMVCEAEQIPYVQIRSISNYVTKRNRDAWDIPTAIKNLNEGVRKIIEEL